eukprot:GFYU01004766.1.p1 GENE.GFYU01004766.1~~GFYU01004766.1.p1  ORF type:complete len:301 (+),score=45.63 GFYU01004766.1:126-1028(+)
MSGDYGTTRSSRAVSLRDMPELVDASKVVAPTDHNDSGRYSNAESDVQYVSHVSTPPVPRKAPPPQQQSTGPRTQPSAHRTANTARRPKPRGHKPSFLARTFGCGKLDLSGAVGRVKINVLEGRDLLPADYGGLSDPYCKVKCCGQRFKSKTHMKTLDPVWDEEYIIEVFDPEDIIYLKIRDYDRFTSDDNLGICGIRVGDCMDGGVKDWWIHLETVPKGEIHVVMQYQGYGGRVNAQTPFDDPLHVKYTMSVTPDDVAESIRGTPGRSMSSASQYSDHAGLSNGGLGSYGNGDAEPNYQ